MNQPIEQVIRRRFSCRSYLEQPIKESHQSVLKDILKHHTIGPFGTHARFVLASASKEDQQALKGLGTYGFIKNPAGFIIGAIEPGEKNLEEYGYLLEHIILSAAEIGVETCWLGGSFAKSGFARRIALKNTESIPAVAAAGYNAKTDGSRELFRKYMNAHRRHPMEQLFFSESIDHPITSESAGVWRLPLEMVRLAPSASNKQPWRIIRSVTTWHFYLQRTKGYGKGTLLFHILRLADLQRVDIGIAMCHFELAANAHGMHGHWTTKDPGNQFQSGMEYITSWEQE